MTANEIRAKKLKLRIKPKYLLGCSWALNTAFNSHSLSTGSSGMHKGQIKGGWNNHHFSFWMWTAIIIIFDMHIHVEVGKKLTNDI